MPGDRPTVILTRPEAQAHVFKAALEDRVGDRARYIVAPVIEIVPVPSPVDPGKYGTLIFTSANGVRALGKPDVLAGHLAYCVGNRTAEAAARAGMRTVVAGGNADALADRLLADKPPGPWLHLSGEHTRGNLADRLAGNGQPTDHAVVYRQDAIPLSAEARQTLSTERVILPVFSPRTATLLSEMIPANAPHPDIAAISNEAAQAWRGPSRRLAIASRPESGVMVDLVGMLVRTDSHS